MLDLDQFANYLLRSFCFKNHCPPDESGLLFGMVEWHNEATLWDGLDFMHLPPMHIVLYVNLLDFHFPYRWMINKISLLSWQLLISWPLTMFTQERKSFDEKFIRIETKRLCELTSAADSLQLKPLVDLTSRALARMIEGKTPEEIRETFHLPDDLTEVFCLKGVVFYFLLTNTPFYVSRIFIWFQEEKLEPLKNTTDDPRIRLLNRLYAKKRKELKEKKKLKVCVSIYIFHFFRKNCRVMNHDAWHVGSCCVINMSMRSDLCYSLLMDCIRMGHVPTLALKWSKWWMTLMF